MPEIAEMPKTTIEQERETRTDQPAAGSSTRGQQQTAGGGMARRESQTPGRSIRDPLTLMRSLSDEMDRLFESFGLGRTRWPWTGRGLQIRGEPALWAPQIDVARRGNDLVVCADLPGMKKEDVHVEVRDDHLILEGERRSENEEDREGLYRSERSYGRFYRTIPLPDGVNPEQAQAQFKDGVLEVRLPLPEQPEQKGRRIEVR